MSSWRHSCMLVWEWVLLLAISLQRSWAWAILHPSSFNNGFFKILSTFTLRMDQYYWCTCIYNVLQSTYALKPGTDAAVSNIIYLCNGHVMHNKKTCVFMELCKGLYASCYILSWEANKIAPNNGGDFVNLWEIRIFFTHFWYRSNVPWMFLWAYVTNFRLILGSQNCPFCPWVLVVA